mmetsp:Transcript_65868/g.147059  ORF Transcript_65868/g.147059 Transcript_65868/m.147059 type:complete len:273 (-) Transcript_65868:29-847(-)
MLVRCSLVQLFALSINPHFYTRLHEVDCPSLERDVQRACLMRIPRVRVLLGIELIKLSEATRIRAWRFPTCGQLLGLLQRSEFLSYLTQRELVLKGGPNGGTRLDACRGLITKRDVELSAELVLALIGRSAVQHLLVVEGEVSRLQEAIDHLARLEKIFTDWRGLNAARVSAASEIAAVKLDVGLFGVRAGQIIRGAHFKLDVLHGDKGGVQRWYGSPRRVRVQRLLLRAGIREEACDLLQRAAVADNLAEQWAEDRACADKLMQRIDAWAP